MRVGTQWVKQVRVSPQELNAIVARLNTRSMKEVKTGSESSQAKAVRLFYQKDAAKGYKEVYVPVKRAQLQQKYLQPVAKTKVYSKEEAKEQAARIQRLVEGLGAYEKPE
ncbi:hypothetical protein ABBQ32_008057 [Trebouxia sp. C0010 RCD-2024]